MLASCIRIALSREAIIAFCLGMFFPVLGFLLQIVESGYPLNMESIVRIHQEHILTWIIDTAPLVLWVMGCLISIYRRRTMRQIKALDADQKNTWLILDSAADGILNLNAQGVIVSGNRAVHQMFGYPAEQLAGKHINSIRPAHYIDNLAEKLAEAVAGGVEAFKVYEEEGMRKDGSRFPVEYSVSVVGEGAETKIVVVIRDVSERTELEEQLNQARKLESMGQLAAGIAHEINTPIQYISDNMRAISEYLIEIETLAAGYQQLVLQLEQQNLLNEQVVEVRALEQQCDLAFIHEDAPKAMAQSLQGLNRVSEIVKAMKSFSHSGDGQVSMLDINDSINSTLAVARNEYKYIAEVETELGELPLVECHAGELNQVFLNLIVNAAHAIEEKNDGRGLIRISTSVPEPGYIEVSIRDNGCGIPVAIQHKIFDPFFTTKEVGKGTGQGLNLAFQTIERRHNGRIYLDSREGEGTQFRLQIPEKIQADPSGFEHQQEYKQAIG